MKAAKVWPIFAILFFPTYAASDGGLELQFDVPAQATGSAEITGLQWALIIFSPSSSSEFQLELPNGAVATNRTRFAHEVHQDGLIQERQPGYLPNKTESLAGPITAQVSLGNRWASLYLEAESMALFTPDSKVSLKRSDDWMPAWSYLPPENMSEWTYRHGASRPAFGVAFGVQANKAPGELPFEMDVRGLRRAEWHNADVTCPSENNCPDPARASVTEIPIPNGRIATRFIPYTDLSGVGSLKGHGTAFIAVAGGAQADVMLEGWARFPAAHLQGSCGESECPELESQTLQTQGSVRLGGLAPVDGTEHRVSSRFAADLVNARLDETEADALLAGAALGGAAVIGAAALVKLALFLFARNNRPLLEHPRAKAIHDLVHGTPGISFSEVKQQTGWGHGTVHYHLKRLLNAGLIVAYTYRNSVRYYENHGRHKADWKEHAALRQPELQALHAWIAEHPQVNQTEVISAAQAWGWKRSTTQHRLKQLLEAALIKDHRGPNSVAYVAVRPHAQ